MLLASRPTLTNNITFQGGDIVATSTVPKSLPVRVQGTGLAEFPWVVTENNQTLFRHKLLKTALREAEVLNLLRMVMPEPQYAESIPLNVRSILKSCQLWYDYSGGSENECNQPGAISDIETGQTLCVGCWRANL